MPSMHDVLKPKKAITDAPKKQLASAAPVKGGKTQQTQYETERKGYNRKHS